MNNNASFCHDLKVSGWGALMFLFPFLKNIFKKLKTDAL